MKWGMMLSLTSATCGGRRRRIRLVEGPEQASQEHEQEPDRDAGEDAHLCAAAGLPVASGQQVPLHHVLVGPEGLQEVEDSSHEQEPEIVLDQAGLPVAQAELSPFPGGGDDLSGVPAAQDQGTAEQASPHQQDPLQEIGPDHALNAARQGVGHGQKAHHQDHPPHVPPGDEGQGQPQEVDGQAHVQHPAQNEGGGGIGLGRIPETGSQVLVGAHSKRAAVEDHEPSQGQKHHQRQAQVIGEGPHVAEVDVSGMTHEGGAAHHRPHEGEPHDPAGQVASGQEVVFRRFLAPGEVEGQAADKRQVDDQDRDVEWAHDGSGGFGWRREQWEIVPKNVLPGMEPQKSNALTRTLESKTTRVIHRPGWIARSPESVPFGTRCD